jgi:hypothetical protein
MDKVSRLLLPTTFLKKVLSNNISKIKIRGGGEAEIVEYILFNCIHLPFNHIDHEMENKYKIIILCLQFTAKN